MKMLKQSMFCCNVLFLPGAGHEAMQIKDKLEYLWYAMENENKFVNLVCLILWYIWFLKTEEFNRSLISSGSKVKN